MAKVTKAYEFLAKNAAKKAAEKPLDVNSKEDTLPAEARANPSSRRNGSAM